MIITQTPLRTSFLGGGTDYPEYFCQHGGATIGTTIDKYTYITVTPLTKFFDYSIRISYSKTELCNCVDEIQHPSVRETMRFLGIEGGVEIVIVSDLPARTGLGSSSAFTTGLLNALHAFKGELVSQEQLAEEAVHIERDMIKERVGYQDQYTCAIGGFLYLEFKEPQRVTVTPIVISQERKKALGERLMIFYTGLQRSAHEILAEQINRTSAGDNTAHLSDLHQLVLEGREVLCNGRDLSTFGDILHQGWLLKKKLSGAISNSTIDDAYAVARRAGAIGGKLLGAGGGGFLMLYVEPYHQQDVRRALSHMREVNFRFENQGSRLVYYRPS